MFFGVSKSKPSDEYHVSKTKNVWQPAVKCQAGRVVADEYLRAKLRAGLFER